MLQPLWNSFVIWALPWDLGVKSWPLASFPLGDLGRSVVPTFKGSTWRISPGLGYAVNIYGDRKSPGGCGTPSKWPNCMAYNWWLLTTY